VHVQVTYPEIEELPEPGTDAQLLAEHYACVTPVLPVCGRTWTSPRSEPGVGYASTQVPWKP
jgi:hypothetical protein